MSTNLSSMKAPSIALLRSFLKPSSCNGCQVRFYTADYMPRAKYAKITSLDKLHRKQKKDLRQERLDSEIRAKAMPLPPYAPKTHAASITSEAIAATQAPSKSPPTAPISDAPGNAVTPCTALPYKIARTPSFQLPVYQKAKAGGTKHITHIRKISGDLRALQAHLRDALAIEQHFVDRQGRKKENILINWRTRQINVRGWRGPEVKAWAQMVGF